MRIKIIGLGVNGFGQGSRDLKDLLGVRKRELRIERSKVNRYRKI